MPIQSQRIAVNPIGDSMNFSASIKDSGTTTEFPSIYNMNKRNGR